MAKKVVATLQSATKSYTKVIKMKKSEKSGAYAFVETMVHADQVKDFLGKK